MPAADQYLSIIHTGPRINWDTTVSTVPLIEVRFNQPVNETFVQTDDQLNRYVILTKMDTDESIPVTYVTWEPATRILKFSPQSSLTAGGVYQVTIRKEIESAAGRRMVENRFWTFQVAASELSTVSLRQPGDATAHVGAPALSWNAASGTAVTGTVYYDVQVHRDWKFGSPLVWSTTITALVTGGVLETNIGVTLDAQKGYFWRVRPSTPHVSGEWSEIRTFWVGDSIQASPDTVQQYNPNRLFHLLDLIPEDGSTSLYEWPTIRATFSENVSSGSIASSSFHLFKTPVDGRSVSGAVLVPGDYTVLDTQVDFIPSETMLPNYRYTLTLTEGIESQNGTFLPQEVSTYFTSYYRPVYGGTIAVRALLGGFIDEIGDDELTFHLWKASLYVNELLYTRIHRVNFRATFSDLVSYQPPYDPTWGMIEISEMGAAISLLEGYYYDLTKDAGRSYALATFRYEVAVELLTEIREKLKELRLRFNALLATFLAGSVSPVTLIQGSHFYPGSKGAWDASTTGFRRSQLRERGAGSSGSSSRGRHPDGTPTPRDFWWDQ